MSESMKKYPRWREVLQPTAGRWLCPRVHKIIYFLKKYPVVPWRSFEKTIDHFKVRNFYIFTLLKANEKYSKSRNHEMLGLVPRWGIN